MKTNLISFLLLLSILGIAGCTDDGDDGDNGVPANTLVVNGTDISLSSNCSTLGSANDLLLTASDVAQDHVLQIRFDGWPTTTRTYTIDDGGLSSEASGTYTVNGNVVYDTQSGTATVTPVGTGFRITFNDVIAEDNNVEVTLSFNGTCN